jgi:TBC1 domain family protein 5
MLEGLEYPRKLLGLTLTSSQAFLLCDDLDRSAWPQRISDSRSAYSSLRDHFLKYIQHPDDLQSAIDPLAEDEEVYRFLSS